MQFPKTFAAAKRSEKGQWAIGDALLEEIGPPRVGARQDHLFTECAAELAEGGMPYKAGYLRELRNIAHKFNPELRNPGLGVQVAAAAGTPEMLAKVEEYAAEETTKAEEKAAKQGKEKPEPVKVTFRLANKVRKASNRATRKKPLPKRGKKTTAEKKAEVAKQTPSELQRSADIGQLEVLTFKAAKQGREFVDMMAGVSLDDDDREVLSNRIDRVIETWKIAQTSLKGSIASEAEEFLAGLEA
jgi:hypothetical protein